MVYIQFPALVLQLIGTALLGIDVLEEKYKNCIEEKIKSLMDFLWRFSKFLSIWFIFVFPVSAVGAHIDSPDTPMDTLASAYPPDSVGYLIVAVGTASYPGVLYLWICFLTKDIWDSTEVKTVLLLLLPLVIPVIILALIIFLAVGTLYTFFKPIYILERKDIISSSVRFSGLLFLIIGTILQAVY